MKLKTYANKIAKLAAQHPNLEVWYASDDEGNQYNKVNWEPSIMNFDKESQCPDEESKQKVIIIN